LNEGHSAGNLLKKKDEKEEKHPFVFWDDRLTFVELV